MQPRALLSVVDRVDSLRDHRVIGDRAIEPAVQGLLTSQLANVESRTSGGLARYEIGPDNGVHF